MPGSVSQHVVGLILSKDDEIEIEADPSDASHSLTSTSNKELSAACAESRKGIRSGEDGMESSTKVSIFISLGALAFTLILIHRCLPVGCKALDVLFAKSHILDDTHAMRTLDTRLGASFNFALVVAVIALFVLVFGAPNIQYTASLVPAPSNSSLLRMDGYGQLNITARLIAPKNSPLGIKLGGCSTKSIETLLSTNLGCSTTIQGDIDKNVKSTDNTMYCSVQINCTTGLNIRGTQRVSLGLPDVFQIMEWTVWSEQWDITKDLQGNLNNPTHIMKQMVGPNNQQVLSGSLTNPTTLNFGVIRSVINDMRYEQDKGGCMTGGMRMSWRDVVRVQSKEGSKVGKHYISFQFIVEENLYKKVLTLKMQPLTQLSLVITYTLSVIAVMGTIKSMFQLVIDAIYVRLAKKKGTRPPEDVERRIRILDEQREQGNSVTAGIEMTRVADNLEFGNPLVSSRLALAREIESIEKMLKHVKKVQQSLKVPQKKEEEEEEEEEEVQVVEEEEIEILVDEKTGKRYSFNSTTGETAWVSS